MSKLDRSILHFEDTTVTYYPDNGEVVDVDVDLELLGHAVRERNPQKELERLRRYRERNASRGEQFYEGIDEDKETKQCTNCKRTFPLSDFNRDIRRLSGYVDWCKDCRAEYMFLYGRGAQGGYLYGTGMCLACGELNPFLMENHHLFGRKNTDDTVSLCSDCHTLKRYYPLTLWPQAREDPESGPLEEKGLFYQFFKNCF